MLKNTEDSMVKPGRTKQTTPVLLIREINVKRKKTFYPKGNGKEKLEGPTQTLRRRIMTQYQLVSLKSLFATGSKKRGIGNVDA